MTPDQQIQDIDARIQALYQEKERLEQGRDAVNAPALVALLIAEGVHFVLHPTYLSRAYINHPTNDAGLDNAIIAYIGNLFHGTSKPIAANLHVHFESGEAYINHEWIQGPAEDRVPALLRALKALGIPKDRIDLSAYSNEVANHERNRARTQVNLDLVRAMVEAY